MSSPSAGDAVVIPALLRAARGAYGHAIHRSLVAAGFDDLPRNGPFVLGGMARQGGSAGDLIRELGVSKQAASQLIDTLVLRGYLERLINPDDRRRMTIELTDRGRAAAAALVFWHAQQLRQPVPELGQAGLSDLVGGPLRLRGIG